MARGVGSVGRHGVRRTSPIRRQTRSCQYAGACPTHRAPASRAPAASASGTGCWPSPSAPPSTSRWPPPSASRRRRRSGCESPGRDTPPTKLAKSAYRKHVRLARLEGGALGIGGIFTAAPDMVALLWIQSRMTFYVAAAYGYDPAHPMRPAELLALQGVYPTAAEAREALDGVGKHMAQAMVERALQGDRDTLHRRLAKYLAKRTMKRYAGKLVPLDRRADRGAAERGRDEGDRAAGAGLLRRRRSAGSLAARRARCGAGRSTARVRSPGSVRQTSARQARRPRASWSARPRACRRCGRPRCPPARPRHDAVRRLHVEQRGGEQVAVRRRLAGGHVVGGHEHARQRQLGGLEAGQGGLPAGGGGHGAGAVRQRPIERGRALDRRGAAADGLALEPVPSSSASSSGAKRVSVSRVGRPCENVIELVRIDVALGRPFAPDVGDRRRSSRRSRRRGRTGRHPASSRRRSAPLGL